MDFDSAIRVGYVALRSGTEWDCGVRGGSESRQGVMASHITGPSPVRVSSDCPPRGSGR